MTLVYQQHTATQASVGGTGATVHIHNEAGQSRLGWLGIKALSNPGVAGVTVQLQGRADDTGDWFVLTEVAGGHAGWQATGESTFYSNVVAEIPLMPQMRTVVVAGGSAAQFVAVTFGGGEVGA